MFSSILVETILDFSFLRLISSVLDPWPRARVKAEFSYSTAMLHMAATIIVYCLTMLFTERGKI